MESKEITAASVEEAIEQAASEWGVEASSLRAEVLEETQGLFGRAGKVRVRVEHGGGKPAAKSGGRKAAKAEAAPVVEEPEAEAEAPVKEAKPKREPRAKKEKEEKTAAAPAAAEGEEGEAETSEPVVASMEDAERLVECLNDILSESDLRAEARVDTVNDRYVNIELDGRDVGFLIGRRGEVLNSLQYLMNVISARQLGNGVRVTVDGSGYREERQTALENHAIEIAKLVRDREEEAVLDALPAFERRIIHKALLDFEGVATYSEGEEPNRRVVIAPVD